jgi:hypothetical protein
VGHLYRRPEHKLKDHEAHVQLPASFLSPPKNPNQPNQANPATSPQASTAPLPTVSVANEQKKKYRLSTETDPLFGDLRDLNFAVVGRRLNRTAHRLEENYEVTCFLAPRLCFLLRTA